MPPRVTVLELRDAIADALSTSYKDYEIEAASDWLGMPQVEDAWTYNSKRVYVRNRLAGMAMSELIQLARRIMDELHAPDLEALVSRAQGMRGVDGELKNLIFAADGPKPRIVLRDAINNVIEIVEGADRCLVYDRPLPHEGLTWGELVAWWTSRSSDPHVKAKANGAHDLYRRLRRSVESPPEQVLFHAYATRYGGADGDATPALIPQVYLHYDPYTSRELAAMEGQELPRQRMDFLLLLSQRRRIVIEVDGQHHYSEDGRPSPQRYAEMVAEDRRIQLAGYEVFRFGGRELSGVAGTKLVTAFFDDLFGHERSQA
jgi:hypothetical protein